MAIGRMVPVVAVALLASPAAAPGQSEWTLGDRALTSGAWSFQRETEQRKMVAVVACWPGSEAWDWGLMVFNASWSAFRSGTVRVRAATETGSSLVRFAHGVVPGVLERGVPSTFVRDVFFAGPRLFLHVEPVGRPGTDMDVLNMSGLREAVLAADTDCDVPYVGGDRSYAVLRAPALPPEEGPNMQQTIAEWAFDASRLMMILVNLGAPLILVGFVLSIFRRTRPWTGLILIGFSFLLGAATWFYGAAVSFASFGWIGLFLGLFLAGVGVVPLGIIGGFVVDSGVALGLIAMLVGTFACRMIGVWLTESAA